MLHKTRGIVFNYIKYSESSLIVTIYTEKFGRQAYMVNGVRGKKSRNKANIFQSLFLLDMEVYFKPNRDLQRAKEIQNAHIFTSLPYDIKKSTLAIFISEILYKTIQEEEPNQELFEYLFTSIQMLDIKDKGLSNFHIYFLTHLSKYLGFFPGNNYSETYCYFDLMAGSFMQLKPMHKSFLDKTQSAIFSKMLQFSDNQHADIKMNYKERIILLEKILEFYTLHSEGLSNIKSLNVLKEVFN